MFSYFSDHASEIFGLLWAHAKLSILPVVIGSEIRHAAGRRSVVDRGGLVPADALQQGIDLVRHGARILAVVSVVATFAAGEDDSEAFKAASRAPSRQIKLSELRLLAAWYPLGYGSPSASPSEM